MEKKIDVEMAKDRAYLPRGGDHSSYRIGHLDHITSTDKKETIRDLLLHTSLVYSFLGVFPVSYWRSPLLHGFAWLFFVLP